MDLIDKLMIKDELYSLKCDLAGFEGIIGAGSFICGVTFLTSLNIKVSTEFAKTYKLIGYSTIIGGPIIFADAIRRFWNCHSYLRPKQS